MSEHRRAAGYCRVSTEEQAEHGFSLGEQERKLQEDAERRGEQWTRVYIDAGVSGQSTERRAQLAAMLAAAEAGEFDVLVIPALDRLGVRHSGRLGDSLSWTVSSQWAFQ